MSHAGTLNWSGRVACAYQLRVEQHGSLLIPSNERKKDESADVNKARDKVILKDSRTPFDALVEFVFVVVGPRFVVGFCEGGPDCVVDAVANGFAESCGGVHAG